MALECGIQMDGNSREGVDGRDNVDGGGWGRKGQNGFMSMLSAVFFLSIFKSDILLEEIQFKKANSGWILDGGSGL